MTLNLPAMAGAEFAAGDGTVPGCDDEAALDPLVNLGCQELPQASELVGGHFLPGDPLVDRIRVDAQMCRNFSDG